VTLPSPAPLLLLAALAACQRWGGEPEDSTAQGETAGPLDRGCNEDWLDAPTDLPEATPFEDDEDLQYRVVELDSTVADPVLVVLFFPRDPELRAYDEGAPVMVAGTPAYSMPSPLRPQPYGEFGLVEVQPIYPGWSMDKLTTGGEVEYGGPTAAAVLLEAFRFAAGQITSSDGHSLGQLVGMPVCNAQVVLEGTSSGGAIAFAALAEMDEALAAGLLGLATYEAPTNPQLTVGDAGKFCLDPDDEQDGDGDSYAWNDGRNHTYAAGACPDHSCDLDYSLIAWDPEVDPSPVCSFPLRGLEIPGALFLDNDGDGRLSLLGGTTPDIDGSGAVEADEDFLFIPHWDGTADDPVQTFTPEATAAAREHGALSDNDWPVHVATPEAASAFWDPRNMALHSVGALTSLGTGATAVVTYTEVDHGVPLAGHPHVHALYEALRQTDMQVRYNLPDALLDCVVEPTYLADWAGELEPGIVLEESELHAHALPEDIPAEVVKSLGTLGVFWARWGPFDRCEG